MGGICSPSATSPSVTCGYLEFFGTGGAGEGGAGGLEETLRGAGKSVHHGLHMQWKSLRSLTLAEFWGVNLCVNITVLENKTLSNF